MLETRCCLIDDFVERGWVYVDLEEVKFKKKTFM